MASAPQRPGCDRPDLRGGFQLCVDMSRALDQVLRTLVEASISEAGFSRDVEAAMLVWLGPSTCVIRHKGLSTQVPCTKGIKQGSRSGPLEWSLITRYVLWRLIQSKGLTWVQAHITNFADDFHACWTGHTESKPAPCCERGGRSFGPVERLWVFSSTFRNHSSSLKWLANVPMPSTRTM